MPSEPSCFIAMPISTSLDTAELYADAHHFRHVMDHLFVPAIKSAGFLPILSMAEGGDLIHAEIVKNLETADLVLCDMTTLNANVFFELGIRTSLDKPVALIKDDQTHSTPFDMTIINHHVYKSDLSPWILGGEIELLETHIRRTAERSEGRNTLWRYLGLTQRGEASEEKDPIEAKLELALSEISSLRTEITKSRIQATHELPMTDESSNRERLLQALSRKFGLTAQERDDFLEGIQKILKRISGMPISHRDGYIGILCAEPWNEEEMFSLTEFVGAFNIPVRIRPVATKNWTAVS